MSIETPLHIIFDEKYVFHYHSMISVIISSGNNLEDIKELCTKLNITWIPYKRPGSLLSDEVMVNLEKSDLVKRSDLEENTVEEVVNTLKKEFE